MAGSAKVGPGGLAPARKPATSNPDPNWIEDAARAIAREIAAYARAVLTIARHPGRFAAEWSAGRAPALNPLAFLLNAMAVLGPWRALWSRLLDPDRPTTPLWFEAVKPVLPIVLNTTVASLSHALLRLFGGRRPLRSSVAMALYASGGPLAILKLLVTPIGLYGYLHRNSPGVNAMSSATNVVMLFVFIGYLVVMQAALHRLARWRVAIAVLASWATWVAVLEWCNIHRPEIIRTLLEA
jgi:hypothetical protein